jgi:glycosyltransferase involved in cell wall biosynthesis
MTDFVHPMLMLEKRLMQESNRIWSISHAIARDVERAYGFTFDPSQISVVPLGVEDWTKRPSISPAPLPDSLRILFVGRLEERKGIDVLFDAIKDLLPTYPTAHVDIVGDDTLIGAEEKTYRELFLADSGTQSIRDRVIFHGSVSDEALRGFYRSCDVFVAPSRYESFGLILLEAMIYSRPVIGSNVGGMAEVVEHEVSGLLAEPGDARSLAACIRQLLDDPNMRRRLGAAGRRRYEQFFKPEHMASGVIEFTTNLARSAERTRKSPTPLDEELV